jgi:hypothetical protein
MEPLFMLKSVTIGFCAALFALGASGAFAQSAPATPASAATPAAPVLEAKALDILKAAGAKLAAAKTMSFTSTSTYERYARNGQPLYYSLIHEVTLQRPDKLKVITPGDGVPDEFYYDGKTMMAYVPSANLVAMADAPESLDKMVDAAFEKAAIYFPFADMIAADPYGELAKKLKSAFYVGRSIAVGGVQTDMIAIASDEVAAEVWIGVEDHLPRQVRVVYFHEPAQARYQTVFADWKLDIAVTPETFASEKAAKATRIEFAPPGDPMTQPKTP